MKSYGYKRRLWRTGYTLVLFFTAATVVRPAPFQAQAVDIRGERHRTYSAFATNGPQGD